MRDIAAELKNLRLYGMSEAWVSLMAQGASTGLQSAHWLVDHLLDAEHTDRLLHVELPSWKILLLGPLVHRGDYRVPNDLAV